MKWEKLKRKFESKILSFLKLLKSIRKTNVKIFFFEIIQGIGYRDSACVNLFILTNKAQRSTWLNLQLRNIWLTSIPMYQYEKTNLLAMSVCCCLKGLYIYLIVKKKSLATCNENVLPLYGTWLSIIYNGLIN